jgi:4-nitrophenyl phosphatase
MSTQPLKNIRHFLLDMDGTLYLGGRLLAATPAFLEMLRRTGRSATFFTNNCTRDAAGYVRKLAAMGVRVDAGQILTSGAATVDYVRTQTPHRRLYVMGTPSLLGEFSAAGFELTDERPDAVVLGFDLTLTYEKVARACRLIRRGVPFIATHPDVNVPTEDGFDPDCGAMTAMIVASTAVQPTVVGKPHRWMIDAAMRRLGARPDETAIVGDRLYTDMEMGFRAGITTCLVLTGETKAEDLAACPRRPDYVLADVGRITAALQDQDKGRT